MSYAKDKDAHTRGVNAIAAVDGVGNRLRNKEAAKARAMNRRDVALATVASRAFRTSTLGAIPTAATGKFTGRVQSTMNTYQQPDMPIAPSQPTSPGGGFYQPGTIYDPRGPQLLRSGLSTLTAQQAGGGTIVGGGTPVIGTVSTTTTGTSTGGGVSSGTGLTTTSSGGGASGGGMWTDPAPLPGGGGVLVIDENGDVVPVGPDTAASSNTKKYLIYAALALGAYWLWRRSKKGA